MKRNLALLLTSVLLVFALTACGGDKKDSTTGDTPPVDDSANNGTGDSGANTPAENGTNGTDSGNSGDIVPGDDNGLNGSSDPADGRVSDSATKQNGRLGASYGQMLRNGRVHDTDGILTDREHAFISGSSY